MFVADAFSPIPEQWRFLAGVGRIDATTVAALADEGARRGQIVGVPMGAAGCDETDAPWTLASARKRRPLAIAERVAGEVHAVLSQRLFVEKARLSTARTPRVIACAEDTAQHVALPRGCVEDVTEVLRGYGLSCRLEDQRTDGEPIDVASRGQLTTEQDEAAARLLAHETGVFVAPPGGLRGARGRRRGLRLRLRRLLPGPGDRRRARDRAAARRVAHRAGGVPRRVHGQGTGHGAGASGSISVTTAGGMGRRTGCPTPPPGALVAAGEGGFCRDGMATREMLTMTAKDLKNRTGEALRAVEQGRRILLTRRGRPVAVMAPVGAAPLEADELSYDEARREIDTALRISKPHDRGWRQAMARSRRRA